MVTVFVIHHLRNREIAHCNNNDNHGPDRDNISSL